MNGSSQSSGYRFGAFILDLIRGALLTTDGHEIPLRPKSFALLRLFLDNAGRLLNRDTIMQAIWPDVLVDEDGIVQCVRDIRRAVGDEAHDIIRTVPRRGYIFLAQVTTVVPRIISEHLPLMEDSQPEVSDVMQAPKCTSPPFFVVVRPFKNLSGRLDDDHLAASLTEDLTTDLARLPAISVIDSDMKCLGGERPGSGRGVCYVIVGSLRRGVGSGHTVDDKLWITMRLIDAESSICLWADRFLMDLSDTEPAWNEIIGRLVQATEFAILHSVTTYRGFVIDGDNQADKLCLQGWAMLRRPHTINTLHRARSYFEQTLRTDASSADAKVGNALVGLAAVANFWSTFEEEGEARIEQLLIEAIDHAGPSGRAFLAMGLLRRLQDRMSESSMALQLAIASDRSDAWAFRQLGYTLAHSGENLAAVAQIEKSLRLNPYDGAVASAYQMLAHCHLLLNDLERSIKFSGEAVARNPWLVSTHLGLASALASSGDLPAARMTLDRVYALKPQWRSVTAIRGSLPYTNPEFLALMNDGMFAGLRRAGMPEH